MKRNAYYLLKERYCHKGEQPKDVYKRVAKALALGDERFEKRLYTAMSNNYFLPASPTLRNAGFKKTLLHPCHVLPIEDNMGSIMECLKNVAIIFHHGGGVGYNFSTLRPKGSDLSTGGYSSGVISFLEVFDKLTETVKQGGFRRGASLCVLDYNHPEILEFIKAKLTGKLINFNLSVLVNDEFMRKINTDEKIELEFDGKIWNIIKAKDLFDLLCFCAHTTGDPGLLFFDRINKNNSLYPKTIIKACNPCSEVPLPDWTCCNLGAINLSKLVKRNKFDFGKFRQLVRVGIRTLLNINAVGWYPFPEMAKQMKLLDPCGLGFMGFADCLIKMGIYYDSEEALQFIDEIAKPYVEITEKLASDSFYKRSQQPTGSLSILADCSSGIEPVFAKAFKRKLSIGVVEEVRELYKSKYCRTALEIDPEWHLKIQAKFQQYIDSGISKTINLPNSASIDVIRNIYKKAHQMGCKGITVFRDGCKEGVLQRIKCDGESCHL